MSKPSIPPPGWKLNWLALYVLAGLLGCVTPWLLWQFMIGLGFLLLTLMIFAMLGLFLTMGITVFLILGGKDYWSASGQEKICSLFALQWIAILWLSSILGYGSLAERLSLHWSKENALAVAAAVNDFHARHGQYPQSLEEVEQDIGHSLPRPICDPDFCYSRGKDSFDLSFCGTGFFDIWYLDGKTGTWTLDDF